MIDRRWKNMVRRVYSISVPDTFGGTAPRSATSTDHSPNRYLVVDMLPHAGCLGLSQRHSTYKGAP
jgi:hypothetical protein